VFGIEFTVDTMQKLQSQGVHHITLTGADRQTSIDFWRACLACLSCSSNPISIGCPKAIFISIPAIITVFTDESRKPNPRRTPTEPGCVHHIAFSVSRATFSLAVKRLDERKIEHSGVKDRGFMGSIYFTDPLGLLIELASYSFEPPHGFTHADVLSEAHKIRVSRGDHNIAEVHLADRA
jgi:glyoxalase family protein